MGWNIKETKEIRFTLDSHHSQCCYNESSTVKNIKIQSKSSYHQQINLPAQHEKAVTDEKKAYVLSPHLLQFNEYKQR